MVGEALLTGYKINLQLGACENGFCGASRVLWDIYLKVLK